jgi:hypothetical protein
VQIFIKFIVHSKIFLLFFVTINELSSILSSYWELFIGKQFDFFSCLCYILLSYWIIFWVSFLIALLGVFRYTTMSFANGDSVTFSWVTLIHFSYLIALPSASSIMLGSSGGTLTLFALFLIFVGVTLYVPI